MAYTQGERKLLAMAVNVNINVYVAFILFYTADCSLNQLYKKHFWKDVNRQVAKSSTIMLSHSTIPVLPTAKNKAGYAQFHYATTCCAFTPWVGSFSCSTETLQQGISNFEKLRFPTMGLNPRPQIERMTVLTLCWHIVIFFRSLSVISIYQKIFHHHSLYRCFVIVLMSDEHCLKSI